MKRLARLQCNVSIGSEPNTHGQRTHISTNQPRKDYETLMTTSTDLKQETQDGENLMTTYIDSKQETQDAPLIPQEKDLNLKAKNQITIGDVTDKSDTATDSSFASSVSTDQDVDADWWEEEMNALAATENYSDWISLDQILLLEEIRPYVSDDIYQQMLSQECSMDEYGYLNDELWSRIATMPEDVSHELFELMSTMGLLERS